MKALIHVLLAALIVFLAYATVQSIVKPIEFQKEQQKRYASTDAWACVQLYEELCRLKKTHDYQLVIREEPQTEIAQTEKSQEDETDLS